MDSYFDELKQLTFQCWISQVSKMTPMLGKNVTTIEYGYGLSDDK